LLNKFQIIPGKFCSNDWILPTRKKNKILEQSNLRALFLGSESESFLLAKFYKENTTNRVFSFS